MKTRTGHIIRLVDDSSAQYIEIIDSKGNNQIKLDTTNNKLTIIGKGDVKIQAQSNVDVEASGNMNIKASGNLSIKGSANVNVEASGQLVLKGSVVNIN